ncbi:hypothetical protein X743_09010 [Mesorhizobium sp. LNHC252B00]|nr:hypothetical protein X743_09010 [Mesorhizobium sp. LNHC252B00]
MLADPFEGLHTRAEDEYRQQHNKKHGGDHDTPLEDFSGAALFIVAR